MKTTQLLKLSSLSLLIILALISCKKKDIPQPPTQKIYFEHYVINYAWGLSYTHWIIDDMGNVRVNCKKDSIVWINSSQLNNSLNYFDSTIYKVDKSELTQYVNLIESASKGKIDSTVQHRADFGSSVYNCYWYNKSQNLYSAVTLSEMSDNIDLSNTDNNAILIDTWLKGLNSKIYSKK